MKEISSSYIKFFSILFNTLIHSLCIPTIVRVSTIFQQLIIRWKSYCYSFLDILKCTFAYGRECKKLLTSSFYHEEKRSRDVPSTRSPLFEVFARLHGDHISETRKKNSEAWFYFTTGILFQRVVPMTRKKKKPYSLFFEIALFVDFCKILSSRY